MVKPLNAERVAGLFHFQRQLHATATATRMAAKRPHASGDPLVAAPVKRPSIDAVAASMLKATPDGDADGGPSAEPGAVLSKATIARLVKEALAGSCTGVAPEAVVLVQSCCKGGIRPRL